MAQELQWTSAEAMSGHPYVERINFSCNAQVCHPEAILRVAVSSLAEKRPKMSTYLGAIDQGTNKHAIHHLRLDGTDRLRLAEKARADLSQTRRVGARPRGNLRRFTIHDGSYAAARNSPKDVAAIGLTNQRETTSVGTRKTASPFTTPSSGKNARRGRCG